MDLHEANIVIPDKGTLVYQESTLTMFDENSTIRSTVQGNCTGTACAGGQGFSSAQLVTYIPEPTLKDTGGNPAGGSYEETLAIF